MAATLRVIFLLLLALSALNICHGNQSDLPRAYERHPGEVGEEVLFLRKRPFCNAFTGCGRKRSVAAPRMLFPDIRQRLVADEESADEEASQDLTRQLISEAKMLEAIQESNPQAYHKKPINYPLVYSLQ